MYFNRYPHCQFANPFCTFAEIPILTCAGILPLAGIPSVQLHIFFLQKQVPFLHRCKNPFSPTAGIFSAQLHVSFLQTFSQEPLHSIHKNHSCSTIGILLCVCRNSFWAFAGNLSFQLQDTCPSCCITSFCHFAGTSLLFNCRNLSANWKAFFPGLYKQQLQYVLHSFYFYFFDNKNMKLVKLQHLQHDKECTAWHRMYLLYCNQFRFFLLLEFVIIPRLEAKIQ